MLTILSEVIINYVDCISKKKVQKVARSKENVRFSMGIKK